MSSASVFAHSFRRLPVRPPLTAAARLVPEHQFSVVNLPEKFRFRRVAQRIRRQGHHSHSCATTGSRLATAVHNNTTSPQPPLLLLPPLRNSRNNLTTGERRQKQCSRQALRSKFNHVGSGQVEEKAGRSASFCSATSTRHRRRICRAQDARRVHRSSGTPTPPPTHRSCTPSISLCTPPGPQLRRTIVTAPSPPTSAAGAVPSRGCHV
jgi:hypothetical protein